MPLPPLMRLPLMCYSIGDIVDTLFALMVVKSCGNIDGGLPSSLHAKMVSNVIIDFVIGLVPFVGDLADAVYKCNTRNAVILEKHLRQKGKKTLKNQRGQPDMSLPEEWDKYANGATGEHPNRGGQEYGTVETPAEARPARHPQRSRSQGRWFGGSKNREGDIERGIA